MVSGGWNGEGNGDTLDNVLTGLRLKTVVASIGSGELVVEPSRLVPFASLAARILYGWNRLKDLLESMRIGGMIKLPIQSSYIAQVLSIWCLVCLLKN